MNNKYTFPLILLIIAGVSALVLWLAHGSTAALFDPQGIIALQERSLMLDVVVLMLLVVVPVFALAAVFAWRYRATNTEAAYTPDWEHNRVEEFVWWGVPFLIIAVLAVITWTSTHALDPYRPLDSAVPPLTVEVISLDWKWLFIYPAQHVATVNYLAIPEQTPIAFKLTSDAPMNAFWIPQLGGQEMAMPGMVTELNLMADGAGTYTGFSSNISGAGFAGMHFAVQSMTQDDFDRWVATAQAATSTLTLASYHALAAPSSDVPPASYGLGDSNLFDEVVMSFMTPATTTPMTGM
ncbi:MAG TPA: ubiquinol oxidase subunit II [Candidatus Paceibacterota bacterium]|nr:ubiquinol oxidase subunit II [Candidatus Paceibacterota bacterium]